MVERAIAYVDAVEGASRRMLDFPDIGAVHPSPRPPIRSLGCLQPRICYEVGSGRVIVIRNLHEAMDEQRHL